MRTHDQLVKKLMRRPGVRAEVERIEREEAALLDALLKARRGRGLLRRKSQAHGNTGAFRRAPGTVARHRQAFPIYRNDSQIRQGVRKELDLARRPMIRLGRRAEI